VGWRLHAELSGRADEGAEVLERRAGRIAGGLLLGWAKLCTDAALGGGALRADAYLTITCSWLSLTTLTGLILNAALGWRWADPLAALVIAPLAVREGLEGWRGQPSTTAVGKNAHVRVKRVDQSEVKMIRI